VRRLHHGRRGADRRSFPHASQSRQSSRRAIGVRARGCSATATEAGSSGAATQAGRTGGSWGKEMSAGVGVFGDHGEKTMNSRIMLRG
jgi:hypothetical protein